MKHIAPVQEVTYFRVRSLLKVVGRQWEQVVHFRASDNVAVSYEVYDEYKRLISSGDITEEEAKSIVW